MKKEIEVFKFGGASVKDADGVKNVAKILGQYAGKPIVIVISASGKTTNNLESVMEAYYHGGDALEALNVVRKHHAELANELLGEHHVIHETLNDIYVEVEWILESPAEQDYDYTYDQLVSAGEMLSTQIVAAYLNEVGLATQWLDARDLIHTDNTFREAQILWENTEEAATALILPALKAGNSVLTQGFIGSTSDNQTTTLGREGSDFTAAILSFCVDAAKMVIWKDVTGVLTGDPRIFKNVQKLDRLSYKEAIEMTYYGASVIHPKTIKPLQNKNIPLHVRSFIHLDSEGTLIGPDIEEHYPPIVMLEKNQKLLQIATKDFSFVVEHHMAYLFKLFADLRIFVNMMRNTAISFTVCVPDVPDRIEQLVARLEQEYFVTIDDNLELLTIRHYTDETVASLTRGKIVLMEERLRNTVQMVVKDIPLIERIAE